MDMIAPGTGLRAQGPRTRRHTSQDSSRGREVAVCSRCHGSGMEPGILGTLLRRRCLRCDGQGQPPQPSTRTTRSDPAEHIEEALARETEETDREAASDVSDHETEEPDQPAQPSAPNQKGSRLGQLTASTVREETGSGTQED